MARCAGLTIAISAMLACGGCGVGQAVKDGTVDAAAWAFTTQVKTMNVDLMARASLNADVGGQSFSTVVRFYQLKDDRTFQKLGYAQLQTNDLGELKADLLATKDVVLRPGASASISEPMNGAARFVGVVAFFREPGQDAEWKLAIPKKQWKKTDPVKIEVRGSALVLVGAEAHPVTRPAPLQSTPVDRKPAPAATRGTAAQSDAGEDG
ncbi:type VI secretion system lipoprotein TssJ [Paraburkholderia rhizosphaerae]|nr:type VI secretion system lipoprotein TssJ [Paraburkholderia rhizosphaerae]